MGFLNPLLLIGIAGVSAPILIHLLNRYRQREIDWGAMELLRRAMVVRSHRVRLEDLLLLLLRCLAVALLAVAMARPTITSTGARLFGGQRQVGVVIAVDASYSMGYEPGISSRFDRAIKGLDQVRGTLTPGNPVSLVLMGNAPRTLLRTTAYDEGRFEKELEGLKPLPERLNLERCLEKLASLMAETKAPVRECYILTDAQQLSWREISPKARRHIEEITGRGKLFVLPTPTDSGENLAVEHFARRSGTPRAGGLTRYVVEVRNHGLRPANNLEVRLFLGDQNVPVDRRSIEEIAPGRAAAAELFARFGKAGDVKVSAEIGRDGLMTDNTRHLVAQVRQDIRVLCVDGRPDPQGRPYRSATDCLADALSPGSSEAGPTPTVKVVGHQQLASANLDGYDVVILANVGDLRTEVVRRLHAFVGRGGGLIVFLGDNTEPRLINARMRHEGETLLPCEVLDAVSAPRDTPGGWGIEAGEVPHPLAGVVGLLPPPLLANARVLRLFELRPLPKAHEVLRLADRDLPLLAEKDLGRGKVLLFASTPTPAWTNFIVHPLGPMVLHEAVMRLTDAEGDRSFTVGQPLSFPLDDRSIGANVRFRSPEGKELPVRVTQRGGRPIAEYAGATREGFYELSRGEKDPPILLANNIDPAESDVKTLAGEDLQAAVGPLGATLLFDREDLAAAIEQSRVGIELFLPLMIAGLVVLLIEGLLAWWFSKTLAAAESTSVGRRRREGLLSSERAA